MTDDPRDILAAAGVKCFEVDGYRLVRGTQNPYITEKAADAAILALARLVAKSERMLRSAVDEWFEDEGGAAGYFEDRELYLNDLRGRLDKR